MNYCSTNRKSELSLREAMIRAIPDEGGLYVPASIPQIPQAVLNNIFEMNRVEIAYVITSLFLDHSIALPDIKSIVSEVFKTPMPLKRLSDGKIIFELFHGNTLAFKDIGSNFMAQMLNAFLPHGQQRHHVLVATTGNTGAAMANAFRGLEDFDIHVLYPRGCMTRSQEAMITTLGDNVHAVEVAGSIDDCKNMVSGAFHDKDLRKDLSLLTANSLNIGRLIPQIVCYYILNTELHSMGVDMTGCRLAMPCGNLSNLTAALVSSRMGVTAGGILGACNANNLLDRFLKDGDSAQHPTVKTLARSIDLRNPSNLPRIMYFFNHDIDALRKVLSTDTVYDDEIVDTIRRVYDTTGYTLDPNTAVAYAAADKNPLPDLQDVIFATTHPAKSLELMTPITGRTMELPLQLTRFMGKKGQSVKLSPTVPAFRKYLQRFINQ